MTEQIEHKALLEVIDGIYGTITGESDWGHVIDRMSRLAPHSHILIHGQRLGNSYGYEALSSCWDKSTLNLYNNYFHTIAPWVDALHAKPPGEVYLAKDVAPDLEQNNPEFFHDRAKPAKLGAGSV